MAQFAGNLNTMLDEQPADGDGAAAPSAARRRRGRGGRSTDAGDAAPTGGPPAPTPRRAQPAAPADAAGAQDRQPGHRAGRPRRRRRPGGPEAAGADRRRPAAAAVRRCAAGADGADGPMSLDDDADRAGVRALLGREPPGRSRSSCATTTGAPVVIRNAPLLDDGTPMPTRYWLVGPTRGARREPAGGRRRRARRPRPRSTRRRIADAHRRYAAERDAALPAGADGRARPAASAAPGRASSACTPTTPGTSPAATTRSGGGSPTRLAARLDVDVGPTVDAFSPRRARHADPRRPGDAARHRARRPRSADAGAADQRHRRRRPTTSTTWSATIPGVVDAHDVHVRGAEPWHLATVERGRRRRRPTRRRSTARRPRTCSGPSPPRPRADRLHNPGLEPDRVDTVLGTCCVVVAVMRRLQLARRHGRRHPAGGADGPPPVVGVAGARAAPPVRPAGHAAPADARRTSPSGARCAGATRPG